MTYTLLQIKTCYSLLESLSKVESLVSYASSLGYNSLAITDSNNMFGVMEFYNTCKKYNIKPIIGLELDIDDKKIYEKFISKFDKITDNSLNIISEIKYDPNEIDKERFLLSMNDGNYVYITLSKFSKINDYSTAVHFGPMTIQPKNRCLNYNYKYEKDRYCIQIKWYNLFDDIIENMNNKIIKSKEKNSNLIVKN